MEKQHLSKIVNPQEYEARLDDILAEFSASWTEDQRTLKMALTIEELVSEVRRIRKGRKEARKDLAQAKRKLYRVLSRKEINDEENPA